LANFGVFELVESGFPFQVAEGEYFWVEQGEEFDNAVLLANGGLCFPDILIYFVGDGVVVLVYDLEIDV
jgi:hypothetical protein